MNSADMKRLNSLMLKSLERAASREQFLRAELASEPELLKQALHMLKSGSPGTTVFVRSFAIGPGDTTSTSQPDVGRFDSVDPDQFLGKNYVLERVLGATASHIVYFARHAVAGHAVAIKLRKSASGDAAADKRFLEETQRLGGLRHPNLAAITDAGVLQTDQGDRLFHATEFIDGADIVVHTLGLGERDKIVMIRRVCEAVAYLHRSGVAHLDLKPGNILVEKASGFPKVIDLGVSKSIAAAGGPAAAPHSGIGGTLPYMAPEQIKGKPDAASDQYALGLILFQMLTNKLPRDMDPDGKDANGKTPDRIRDVEIITGEAKRLRQVLPGASPRLERILARALEREPGDRYAGVAEFSGALQCYLDDKPLPDEGVGVRTRLFVRRHRRLLAVSAMIVLALSAAWIAHAVRQEVANREAERRKTLNQQADDDNKLLSGDLDQALPTLLERYDHAREAFSTDGSWVDLEDMAYRARQLADRELLKQQDEVKSGARPALDYAAIEKWDAAAVRHAQELERLGCSTDRSLAVWYAVERRRADLAIERKEPDLARDLLNQASEVNERVRRLNPTLAAQQGQTIALSSADLASQAGEREEAIRWLDAAQADLDQLGLDLGLGSLNMQVLILKRRFRWAESEGERSASAADIAMTVDRTIPKGHQAAGLGYVKEAVDALATMRSALASPPEPEFNELVDRLDAAIVELRRKIPPVEP